MTENVPLDKNVSNTAVKTKKNEVTLDDLIKTLGESFDIGVVIFDPNLNVLAHNAATLRHNDMPQDLYLPGRSGKDIVEHAIRRGDFGPDITLAETWNNIRSKSALHESDTAEFSRTALDGRVIKTRHSYGSNGVLIVLTEDITKTQRREQLMDLAMVQAGAGYWQYSFKDNKFTISDSILSRLSDREKARIYNDGLWSILHPEDVDRIRIIWSEGFKSQSVMDFCYRVVLDKAGVVYQRNIGIPIFSEAGKPIGVNCFIIDQTEERVSLQSWRRRAEDAERMNKAQNEYLANMSHEIRTPMNGVLGMTEALLQTEAGETISEQLGIIRDSANMLLKLMDDTLDHAKLAADKVKVMPELTAPRTLLHNIKTLWDDKANSNGTKLTLRITDNVPDTLIIDPLRYHQCLNNLLSNAIKFTKNGQVDVICTVVERSGLPYFVTAIRDTGIGMTPEQLRGVFTPFQQATDQTSADYGGTGLGMSIVKRLSEVMGGKVSVKSQPTIGTTFALTLPLKRREGERRALPRAGDVRRVSMDDAEDIRRQSLKAQKNPPASQETRDTPVNTSDRSEKTQIFASVNSNANKDVDISRLTVLVAEDNQINQLVVRSLLEPKIAEMIIADDGQAAIEILKTRHVDVILMDIHMPIMDGIEATLAIRNSGAPYADTKIIALTADPDYQQVRICKNIGMNYAIPKPLNFNELMTGFNTVFSETPEKVIQTA
ncbi:hybrid sensor histidine kinase/response regulator [Robiginitomaculum antarcticum]|uniref:hybrid sensor histidine kinase/response regulator n=1 Tax=Robiginitomaculum antarcticum TaxID=437507 RepID=UPI00036C01A1|nr:ATP-binding protein [Robiginitomaculum antarcticum]